jgi:hypothetical protein
MLGIAAHQGLLVEIVLGRKRVQSEKHAPRLSWRNWFRMPSSRSL